MALELWGATPFGFFEPLKPGRAVEVVARGGASKQAPANTRSALIRCIEDGVEWAEVDVRRTRDGEHVLAREPHLVTGEGTQWSVEGRTLSELRTVDIGSAFGSRYAGERILTLKEALELIPSKLNLSLRCWAVNPGQLVREVLASGVATQVVVCDEVERLSRVRSEGGDRVALKARWEPRFGVDVVEWARAHSLAVVEIDAARVSLDMCRALKAIGVKVEATAVGEMDRVELWRRSLGSGVDWIRTELAEEVVAEELWYRMKKRPVRFSLHRGAGRYAPENTMLAFEKSIRLGADLVEFDVRTTLDGRHYLLHDSTLEGKTDGHGPIAGRTAKEVDAISAGVKFGRAYAELRLPTLDEFLTAMRGKVDLYFDAKAIAPGALAEALERHGVVERTVVYQSVEYLERLGKLNPRIRLLPPLGSVEELAGLTGRIKPYGVDVPWRALSRELVGACHERGILVFSDGLGSNDRVEEHQKAIGLGVDVIQTDHPLRVMRAMDLSLRR